MQCDMNICCFLPAQLPFLFFWWLTSLLCANLPRWSWWAWPLVPPSLPPLPLHLPGFDGHVSQPWLFGASQPCGLLDLGLATCFHTIQWVKLLLGLLCWINLRLEKQGEFPLGRACLRMKLTHRGKPRREVEAASDTITRVLGLCRTWSQTRPWSFQLLKLIHSFYSFWFFELGFY